MGKFSKGVPEYIYFIGGYEWLYGPYLKPKEGRVNRKFKLIEVEIDEQKTEK